MSTQAQILANRENAQKSTGPRTPAGKATASQNAVKHGLSARCDVISTEDQAEFDAYRDSMIAELAPQQNPATFPQKSLDALPRPAERPT